MKSKNNLTNQQIFREFVNGTQNAKTAHGTLYIENGVLYSYGKHWPLAVKVKETFYINGSKYSRTTSKQTTQLRREIPRYCEHMLHVSEMKKLVKNHRP